MAKDETDSRAAVPLLRDVAAQHAGDRFLHQDNQPPPNDRALIARIGVRHWVKVSKPLRTPADAPAAARPRGTTQHDEAMMAVRPEANPTTPNQRVDLRPSLGAAASGEVFCNMFYSPWLIWTTMHPVATTGASGNTAMSLTIGKLAAAAGANLETVRYYERIKLMPEPSRTASGHRAYDGAHLRRLRFIRRGRELGFSIEDIRTLLSLAEPSQSSCNDVREIAKAHLANVRDKVADLQKLERILGDSISGCSTNGNPVCPVLEMLADDY